MTAIIIAVTGITLTWPQAILTLAPIPIVLGIAAVMIVRERRKHGASSSR